MPTRRLALIAAAALTATAAFAAPAKEAAKPHAKAADAAPAKPADMSLGSPRAKVELVEYASLSCPHCARFNNDVFPAFRTRYVDTGKVRYTLREMLTPPAQVAAAGFLLARCAGPAKYFKVVDEVFRSQPRWTEGDGDIRPIFLEIAKNNGLTEPQFDACLSDQAGLAALQARVQTAVSAGVNATPTFFINGKKVGEGEMTLEQLDAAIAEAKKPKKGG
jgi:protein-disulfide isomerase